MLRVRVRGAGKRDVMMMMRRHLIRMIRIESAAYLNCEYEVYVLTQERCDDDADNDLPQIQFTVVSFSISSL